MRTVVLWKPYLGASYGSGELHPFDPWLPGDSGWVLLHRLQNQPRQSSLSYQDACRMVRQEVFRQMDLRNNDPNVQGSSHWVSSNWPEWLSAQGYHVELTGEEFEILSPHPVTA